MKLDEAIALKAKILDIVRKSKIMYFPSGFLKDLNGLTDYFGNIWI